MNSSYSIYYSEGIPAMQHKLFSSRSEALGAPSATLDLCQDETGIVFNRQFNPAYVAYDPSYQSDQGYSNLFRSHLDQVWDFCSEFLEHKDGLVIDIGCGKGGFVELLRERGVNAVGYDNTYQGKSPYIQKAFFGSNSHGKGDLLVLRHVLEHIPSPLQFLASIAVSNGNKGILYIEVPDLDWILRHNAYFDLFHEHVNYFRSDDFVRIYGKAVISITKTFNGQYLSVVLDLSCISKDINLSNPSDNNPSLLQSFENLSVYERNIYLSLMDSRDIVIWGAGAKGVMFAAKAPLAIKKKIIYAIDINPAKQFHFMPLSAVEVLSPAAGISRLEASTLVVVMNPNYEQEIRTSLPSSQLCLILQ